METELFQAGVDLTALCISKLSRDTGGDNCVDLFITLQERNGVQNKGSVGDGAKGTAVHTGAAGNTFAVVDPNGHVWVHGDGARLTGLLAGSLLIDNRGERTDACTLTTVNAFAFVNVCVMVFVQGNCVTGTYGMTVMGQAASAEVGHGISAGRALVAGNVKSLNNVRVGAVAADGQFDPLRKNGQFLVGVKF